MNEPAIDALVVSSIRIIRRVQQEVAAFVASDPAAAFGTRDAVPGKKPLLIVDDYAETRTRILLSKSQIKVIGEESLMREEAKDLTAEAKIVALLDMIDGTDLLERGLANWCSAMVFLDPRADPGQRILAALVGLPDEGVYYAARHQAQVRKYRFHVREGEARDVALPKGMKARPLSEASVCFYGQQVSTLIALFQERRFLGHLGRVAASHKRKFKKNIETRIYNLAGNPMMVKMTEGHRRIDAVFDTHGQFPHDFVAGAYIAGKSGATLLSLSDGAVDLEESALHPSHPEFKATYVIASHESLAHELKRLLTIPKKASTPLLT